MYDLDQASKTSRKVLSVESSVQLSAQKSNDGVLVWTGSPKCSRPMPGINKLRYRNYIGNVGNIEQLASQAPEFVPYKFEYTTNLYRELGEDACYFEQLEDVTYTIGCVEDVKQYEKTATSGKPVVMSSPFADILRVLEGRTLTIIDALISDGSQNPAIKSLIKKNFSTAFNQARDVEPKLDEGSDQIIEAFKELFD